MGYSITGEPPAQCVYGAKSTPLHETDTVPERYRAATRDPEPLECPIIAGFPTNSINERGFGSIPTRVMDDVRLSMGARCLYALLAAHAGSQHEAWPSVKRIIATLACSEKTFYKYRAELSDAGYISIETRQTRYGRRTVYVIEQIVEYPSVSMLESEEFEEKFSTNPSSEPYSNFYRMAADIPSDDAEMWKTNGGKPSHTVKTTGTHTVKSTAQNINKAIKEKNSTTTPTKSDSQLEQGDTAIAGPVVSSPTAPSSGVDLDVKKNEEATLVRDSIDERFYALEARSLRRTGSPARKEAARLSYHKLVAEGHSPDDIDAAYSNYVRWVESDNVKNKMGLASWLVDENGFTRNDDEVKAKRAAEYSKRTQEVAKQADLDYRRRSAAVKRELPDSDAECAYLFAYADSSDDQRLRDVAAQIRAQKPVQYSNGYIDDRLSRRPSYCDLVRLVHSREHNRQYNETTYSALVAEGKIRG
ncbi:helix-turn-helix domain-containing protein [Ellagibacter isourolithinifaciens]|uniref:helix-turn-helix domain-containing protein n=1 Tax=Ellagibacter isourolithinifaciens TaxID=2137581 RepID=UPI003A932A1A